LEFLNPKVGTNIDCIENILHVYLGRREVAIVEIPRRICIVLSKVISENLIQLKIQAVDWQDAIRKAAQPMVDEKKITLDYVDAMIEVVFEDGPYIVITKYVALPHADSKRGALINALTVSTLETPVYFGNPDNDPVKYLFCLSAKDNSSHLEVMAELAELLDMSDFYKMLDNATSTKDVMNYIENFEVNR